MKKYVIPIVFFFTVVVYGQQVSGNISYPPAEYKAETLDTSQQNITYQYTFVKDPKKREKKKSSYVLLQIGNKYSKFADVYTLKKDSIQKAQKDLERVGVNEINAQLRIAREIGFQKTIFRDLKQSHILLYCRRSRRF